MRTFKNAGTILESIVGDLLALEDTNHKKNWNLVIPPTFYAGPFAHELVGAVQCRLPDARVASISADGVFSPKDMVIQIHYEWLNRVPSDLDDDLPPKILLAKLLDRVGDGVNVLIISEFHKILSRMDERILVALRDAEQAGRLHTVAISIYPHKWLRQMWKKEGHLLSVSNYGDHKRMDVEPYSQRDILRMVKEEAGPEALANLLYEWTGGFPEALDAVLESWRQADKPGLSVQVRGQLRATAEEALQRVGQLIDPEGSSRFSELIVAIHQHSKDREKYEQVRRFHPWSRLLLDDDGLRADTLGDVLTRNQVEKEFRSGKIGQSADSVVDVATAYYHQEQYDLALAVLDHYRESYDTNSLRLLSLHARAMQALREGSSATSCPNLDTEWRQILSLVEESRQVMPSVVSDEMEQSLLCQRYDDITQLAKSVTAACRGEGGRCIDQMGGLLGGSEDRETAFGLLVFQLESATSIRGNAAACRAVLEMPEQILRLWALWAHSINYYSALEIEDCIWQALTREWPAHKGAPTQPVTGKQFPSLLLFCYYIYAFQQETRCAPAWMSAKALESELSVLLIRNDIAHATVYMTARTRGRLFDFIEKWLDRLEADCMSSTTRSAALSLVEPLPLPLMLT